DSRIRLQQTVDELRAQLASSAKTIKYYNEAALREADELRRNAVALYQESETGMTELVQSLNASRDIRNRYIDAVADYNVAAIELELYTGSK
ncbi:MAG: hypothetical protein PUB61_09640, partial [Bacteroidales bacterium]|nr:hypothetical protein [Bacteroidales bacterium]